METIIYIALLPIGLTILLKGANWLVDGAVALAKRLNVSPLIVGLTVVAMGTSAPEVAASITAALKGLGNTALGNVYGSNIANLALVGGFCAILRPISVRLQVLKREMPVMLLVGLALWPFLGDQRLDRVESSILLLAFAALMVYTVFSAKRESKNKSDESTNPDEQITDNSVSKEMFPLRAVILVVVGLAGLALGADLTIRSAVYLGQLAGLSDAVIGLTIVAVGTSLPELVTCVVATTKGHDDISIGNLVGSNIFNTLLVVGCAGVLRPFDVDLRLAGVDYWIMIAVSAAFVTIAVLRRRIGRLAGAALLSGYGVYIIYLLVYTRNS